MGGVQLPNSSHAPLAYAKLTNAQLAVATHAASHSVSVLPTPRFLMREPLFAQLVQYHGLPQHPFVGVGGCGGGGGGGGGGGVGRGVGQLVMVAVRALQSSVTVVCSNRRDHTVPTASPRLNGAPSDCS